MQSDSDRLARVETKLDIVIENQNRHLEHHFQFNLRATIALIVAGLALLLAVI